MQTNDLEPIEDVLPLADNQRTLLNAQQELYHYMSRGKPTACSCCGRKVTEGKERISGPVIMKALFLIYHRFRFNPQPFHILDFFCAIPGSPYSLQRGGDVAKLRHWGLLQKTKAKHYVLTDKGKQFVEKSVSVPLYIRLFNRLMVGSGGGNVTVLEALKSKEKYESLHAEAIALLSNAGMTVQ